MAVISSLTMVGAVQGILLSIGGTELTDSRRLLDLGDITAVRCQFKASAAIAVRIECSFDGGATWSTLCPETNLIGNGDPYCTAWFPVDPQAVPPMNDTLLRALGIGSGLLVNVAFVILQFR